MAYICKEAAGTYRDIRLVKEDLGAIGEPEDVEHVCSVLTAHVEAIVEAAKDLHHHEEQAEATLTRVREERRDLRACRVGGESGGAGGSRGDASTATPTLWRRRRGSRRTPRLFVSRRTAMPY